MCYFSFVVNVFVAAFNVCSILYICCSRFSLTAIGMLFVAVTVLIL